MERARDRKGTEREEKEECRRAGKFFGLGEG